MSKITLDVTNENLETVLTILENLKSELIENLHVDKSAVKYKPAYKPQTNKVIKENAPIGRKYIDPAGFKKRLKKSK